jgi:hypothetical protein
MSLAVEGNVEIQAGGLGVLRVRANAVERTVEIIGYVAVDFAVVQGGFRAIDLSGKY